MARELCGRVATVGTDFYFTSVIMLLNGHGLPVEVFFSGMPDNFP